MFLTVAENAGSRGISSRVLTEQTSVSGLLSHSAIPLADEEMRHDISIN